MALWLKLGTMILLGVVLTGCEKAKKFGLQYPPPNEERLAKAVKVRAPQPGWEPRFEEVIDSFGLSADRYEWQTPVRGSFRVIDVGKSSGPRAGTVVNIADYKRWFGCGWAFYSNPPYGVDSKVARIAALFSNGRLANAVFFNIRAQEACRFAPPAPKNASSEVLEAVQNPPSPSMFPIETIETAHRRGKKVEEVMYGGLLIEIRKPRVGF